MLRYMTVVAVLAGCSSGDNATETDERYGTYAAQRVITASEPSPNFEVPLLLTVTVTASSVETSSGEVVFDPERDGSMLTFTTSEAWTSPEGTGAATLVYTVELPGDGTLTGTIAAHVIFDEPPIYADFDYTLAVEGTL